MKTAYAIRRPVANAYLVRERDRRRLRELWLVLLCALPLLLVLIGYTSIRLEVVRIGARIDGIERTLGELRNTERRLLLDTSRLRSPGRVERYAGENLGLRPPVIDQLIFAAGEP